MNKALGLYAFFLLIAGFVAVGVYGLARAQREEPAGVVVLVLLGGGLILALVYAWRQSRNARNTRRMLAGESFRVHAFRSSATAVFKNSGVEIWDLIRPAEFVLLTGRAVRAFNVPGTRDGENELQCFISAEGHISAIEVISEDPGRRAVTRSVCHPEHSVETTYTLESSTDGCRLTIETFVESAVPVGAAEKRMFRAANTDFVEKVGGLLESRLVQGIGQNPR